MKKLHFWMELYLKNKQMVVLRLAIEYAFEHIAEIFPGSSDQ